MKKKSLNVKKHSHKKLFRNLKNLKIKRIYNIFKNSLKNNDDSQNLAVALSGGPDSLALCYFAKCYGIEKDINIFYYIVDHKLRTNSSKETNQIVVFLKKFNIKCKVLTWRGKKPTSNIQSTARESRYTLLFNQCLNDKVQNILFGHHIDDLYENFFIRLLRGSGLKGLASFNETKTERGNKINILRPFINVDKKSLTYVAKYIFNFYIKDPSNSNNIFTRVRIRKMINNLKKEGLDNKKLILTLNNLQDSNKTINHYVDQNILLNSNFSKDKPKVILNSRFFQEPNEIVFRSISKILKKIGKKYYYPRGKSVAFVLKKINSKNFKKISLANCIIEKLNNSYIIYKEMSKIS